MNKPLSNRYTATSGISVVEYATLLGLIGIVALVALQLLGGNTSLLLSRSNDMLAQGGTMNLLQGPGAAQLPSPTVIPAKGSGYYGIVTDSVTGQPTLKLTDGVHGLATNVSSIDGSRFNTLGSTMISKKLAALASKEANPAIRNYLSRMARASYYLGGIQGELDDVPRLDLDVAVYGNGAALRDLIYFQKDLQQLMTSPPGNMSSSLQSEVMPLATTVYNISQSYRNQLSQFVTKNGEILQFSNPETGASGNKTPGSVFETELAGGKKSPNQKRYDQLVPYHEMLQRAADVLADFGVESARVESTLTHATAVDQAATASP